MKKVLSLILIVIMICTLCACGAKTESEEPTTESTGPSATTSTTETTEPVESTTDSPIYNTYNVIVATKINETPDKNGVSKIVYILSNDNKLTREIVYSSAESHKTALDTNRQLYNTLIEIVTPQKDDHNDGIDNRWNIVYRANKDTVISEFEGDITNCEVQTKLIEEMSKYFADIVPNNLLATITCKFTENDETTGEKVNVKHVHSIRDDGVAKCDIYKNDKKVDTTEKTFTKDQVDQIWKMLNIQKETSCTEPSVDGKSYEIQYYKSHELKLNFTGTIHKYQNLQRAIDIVHFES